MIDCAGGYSSSRRDPIRTSNAHPFSRPFATCFAVLLVAAVTVHAAQSVADSSAAYPTRPVRLIVPFPPGGSNDILGRYLAHYLTERLGRQVVIDNRGGADGIIG